MSKEKMPIKFYGLLYLDAEESSTQNSYVKDFEDQVLVYLNCAISLSKSFELREIKFTLITNKQGVINKMLQVRGESLQTVEIPFSTEIPHGTRFYSAHFKLDVFRYLSLLNDDYVGFCDLDMLCINDLPGSFHNNIKQKIPMCYDISDQVIQAYGRETVMRNLQAIHGLDSEGRWSGGEFISGNPDFFLILSREIDRLFDNYIKNINNLNHVGDEAITSAALEVIRLNGMYVADAGTLGIVGRYWNTECLHYQRPFEYFRQCFILHLPSDKRFLSSLSNKEKISLSIFEKHYKNYRTLIQSKSKFKQLVKKILIKASISQFKAPS